MGGHRWLVPGGSTAAAGRPRITSVKMLRKLEPASGATDPPRRQQSYSAEIPHNAAFLVQSRHRTILVSTWSRWTSIMLQPPAEPAEALRTRRSVLTAEGGVMVHSTM